MKDNLPSNMFVAICQRVAEHNIFLQVRVMVTWMDRWGAQKLMMI